MHESLTGCQRHPYKVRSTDLLCSQFHTDLFFGDFGLLENPFKVIWEISQKSPNFVKIFFWQRLAGLNKNLP
jgi:hypothetical protein